MKTSLKNLKLVIQNYLNESQSEIGRKELSPAQKNQVKKDILQNLDSYYDFADPKKTDDEKFGMETSFGADMFGTEYDDYQTTKGVQAKELRRNAKRIWNENADHDFFKNNIAKLHQLEYQGGEKTSLATSYLQGGNTELSAFGIMSNTPLKPAPEELKNVAGRPGSKYYIILNGRCTWVGDFDAFTEELGLRRTATAKRTEKRASAIKQTGTSGMPKRPGGIELPTKKRKGIFFGKQKNIIDFDTSRSLFPIILDKQDVMSMSDPLIDEMIVDNWNVESLTCFVWPGGRGDRANFLSLKSPRFGIDKIAAACNKEAAVGISSFYHKFKEAVERGYPQPRICDYGAGRYWTDQEVKELFDLLN